MSTWPLLLIGVMAIGALFLVEFGVEDEEGIEEEIWVAPDECRACADPTRLGAAGARRSAHSSYAPRVVPDKPRWLK